MDPEVIIVPVVIVGWDGPDHATSLRPLFDFIRSDPFSAQTTPPSQEPTPLGPFGNPSGPAGNEVPPDDIWNLRTYPCGVQFQVVQALWLGPAPEGCIEAGLALTQFGCDRCTTQLTGCPRRDFIKASKSFIANLSAMR